MNSREALDNFTARALLMPLHETIEYLDNTHFAELPARKRIKHVKAFAKSHCVDEIQVIKRFTEVLAMQQSREKG